MVDIKVDLTSFAGLTGSEAYTNNVLPTFNFLYPVLLYHAATRTGQIYDRSEDTTTTQMRTQKFRSIKTGKSYLPYAF